jgi:hypothetical protein
VGLQSPRGRLLFFAVITIAVFVVPYDWLAHLSLWQALHIPAPSIGLTRAYHLLLHGNIAGAWRRNELIFPIIGVGTVVLGNDARVMFKRHTKQTSARA